MKYAEINIGFITAVGSSEPSLDIDRYREQTYAMKSLQFVLSELELLPKQIHL
jgi:hypothetical protein